MDMLTRPTVDAQDVPGGISPKVWGPAEWVSLFSLVVRLRDAEAAAVPTRRMLGGHTHAAAAPAAPTQASPELKTLQALRATVVARINATPDTLVCQAVCAPHMRTYLHKHPLDDTTLTAKRLLAWLRGLRADVDARQGRVVRSQ